MVTLKPRFTLLAFSLGLSSLTLGPAHAAVVRSPTFQESYVQSPFMVPRSATQREKRHHVCRDGTLIDIELLKLSISLGGDPCEKHHGKRSSVIIPSQDGTSYYVASSTRSPFAGRRDFRMQDLVLRDEKRTLGEVNVLSDKGEKLGSLYVKREAGNTYTLASSNTSVTKISVVEASSPSSSLSKRASYLPIVVTLRPDLDQTDSNCVTYYDTEDGSPISPMAVTPCAALAKRQEHASQLFEYDQTTGALRPFSERSGPDNKDSTSSDKAPAPGTKGDLDGRDETSIELDKVTLKFVPDARPQRGGAQLAAVDPADVVTSTTTVTSTVTVTGSATPSASAQGTGINLSAPPSTPSASTPMGSTSGMVTPTPAVNQFKVKVVGASDSSTSVSTPGPSAAAQPTASADTDEVASRIAGAQAQNSPSPASPKKEPASPAPAALVAAPLDESPTPSGNEPSRVATTSSSGSSSTPIGTNSAVDSAPAISPAPTSSTPVAAPETKDTSSPPSEATPTPTITPLNVFMESQA